MRRTSRKPRSSRRPWSARRTDHLRAASARFALDQREPFDARIQAGGCGKRQAPLFLQGCRNPRASQRGRLPFDLRSALPAGRPFCHADPLEAYPHGGLTGAPAFRFRRPLWLGVRRRRGRSRLRAQRDRNRSRQGSSRSVVGAPRPHEAHRIHAGCDPPGGDGLFKRRQRLRRNLAREALRRGDREAHRRRAAGELRRSEAGGRGAFEVSAKTPRGQLHGRAGDPRPRTPRRILPGPDASNGRGGGRCAAGTSRDALTGGANGGRGTSSTSPGRR